MNTATTEPAEEHSRETHDKPTVDKSGERIKEMFGEISPRYDMLNHVLSGGTDIYWRARTVRMVSPTGTAPILDTCTGTGDLALAWWKRGKGKISVVGTDFTHQMLTRAGEKRDQKSIPAEGTPSLSFMEADTQHLPFPDDTFQIVSVAFGLRNVSDMRAGLREMLRVAQPGGRIAVLEFAMPRNRILKGMYRTYFRKVLPRIGQVLMKNKQAAYEYLPKSVEEFPQREELKEIMEECGLVDVSFKPLTFGVSYLYVGHKPLSD